MTARQTDSAVSDDYFSYANEEQIDPELKCAICGQPFVKPMVGKNCGHTFCQVCINNWQRQNSSCPVCRTNTSFYPLITRIILSQLDRLLVRCSHCGENNIQRGDFEHHVQHQCRRIQVQCKAADLKCSWKGKREELARHEAVCPLLQIRPVIEELRAELSAQAYQLRMFMDEIQDLRNSLQQQHQHVPRVQNSARVSNTNDEATEEKRRYDTIVKDLRYDWVEKCRDYDCKICDYPSRNLLKCLVCSRTATPNNIRLHDSYKKNLDDVICRLCVKKYGRR